MSELLVKENGDGTRPAKPRAVSAAAVRAELDKILSSSLFSPAGRAGRFLSFVIEESLRDDSERLSEYTLGVKVFDRKESFDPSVDPIVRVEASRLRKKLRTYYETEGLEDPVVIEIPPRTYVPVFTHRTSPGAAAGQAKLAELQGGRRLRVRSVVCVALIIVTAVCLASVFWRSGATGGVPPAPSIAVLPFRGAGNDEDHDYFRDGLTEELIESLTKLEGLRVASKTSALSFDGKVQDVRTIGQQLGVALILEGSVRQDADSVRVTVQLVDARTGYHEWSQAFERSMKDVFAVQKDIARAVVARLTGHLQRERWLRPLDEDSPPPAAYGLYLRGLQGARRWTPERLREAIDSFRQAIQIEPEYAAAHAELALCYAMLATHPKADPRFGMERAREASRRAIQLDPYLPDAHAALGLVQGLYDWDWPAAQKSFLRAHDMDPTDPTIHEAWVLGYLVPRGHLDEALAETIAIQSYDPLSSRVSTLLGSICLFRRQPNEAAKHFRKAIELDPRFTPAHVGLRATALHGPTPAGAVRGLEELASSPSATGTSLLVYTLGQTVNEAQARAVAQNLPLQPGRIGAPAVHVALAQLALGEKQRALEWLNRAYEARSPLLAYLPVNPHFDSLRSDPEFVSLVRRIHPQ